MLVRIISRQPALRRFFSAAPPSSSGIEHAIEFKKTGANHKQDIKNYKCSEYLHFGTYSYYDPEMTMLKSRVAQPTPKKHDVVPSVKAQNVGPAVKAQNVEPAVKAQKSKSRAKRK